MPLLRPLSTLSKPTTSLVTNSSRLTSITATRHASTDTPVNKRGPLTPPDLEEIDLNASSGDSQARPRPRISDAIHPPKDLGPEASKHNEEVARRNAGAKEGEHVERGFWTGQSGTRNAV